MQESHSYEEWGEEREEEVCQLLDLTVPSEGMEPVFQVPSLRLQFLKTPVLLTPSSWDQISRCNGLLEPLKLHPKYVSLCAWLCRQGAKSAIDDVQKISVTVLQ